MYGKLMVVGTSLDPWEILCKEDNREHADTARPDAELKTRHYACYTMHMTITLRPLSVAFLVQSSSREVPCGEPAVL
jgi:hypothetical protein